METLKVEIDRQKWLRGEGAKASYLLRPSDGKMCCIGFACLAAGCTPEQISNQQIVQSTLTNLYDTPLDFRTNTGDVSLESLYVVNDDLDLEPSEREERLKRLGLKRGIEFTFVN